ncbi:hypothetical protein PR202_gb21963 [Eleusine coracana subsp. coracana]|uniref:MATH domain-containing protein n=1 Tax=Eleusine coracana subsp. coracana TaxID=191504 RepID=A0AAV5FCH2_ELECO|nr:hypothetical protein PR202_gb21963 [Eleusine coracana subsp. coracana]
MLHNMVAVTYSAISATESTGCHVLKLSGYREAKTVTCTGNYLKSARFDAAGHSWRIVIYPNGNREKCDPGCIALGLMLDSESKDVEASVHFSFLRHGAKLTANPHGGRVTAMPVIFKSRWAYQGFRHAGKKELQDEAYIKDGVILIRCDITVFNKPAVVKQRQGHALQAMMELFCDCDKQHCNNLHVAGGSHLIVPPGTNKLTNGYLPLPSHDNKVVAPPPSLPSASTITVRASRGCHVMKLSGYWRTKLIAKNGTPVESAEFEVAGHRWRIRCYPNGDCEKTAGYMSLLLEICPRDNTDLIRM